MRTVSAENLGKAYRLYARPVDRALEWAFGRPRHQEFWALRELDLAVSAGEAIGIIGENGAGKSTLLALLTGTTRPTTGRVAVHGKLAAILELGAGFHPEFSGRHNARMHAALFGITGAQADRRIEEAIAFSELGGFIDQPVRTYSSGMYVRLAFALAVSVDPEVLVIDEALAVGDQHFQTKCVDRITDFREQGKTILFCSHAMYQVKKLCDRALWLRQGRVAALGPVDEVIDAYLEHTRVRDQEESAQPASVAREQAVLRLLDVTLEGGEGDPPSVWQSGTPLTVRVVLERAAGADLDPGVGIAFVRNDGLVCYCVSTEMDGVAMERHADGTYRAVLHVPQLPLLGGGYYLNVATIDNRSALLIYDVQERCCPFRVRNPSDEFGVMRMDHAWLPGAAATARDVG
jgi:lipopolysaccharide transport system ATP-binding protein